MRTLDALEAKLKAYIEAEGIAAEQLIFETSCHSVAEAAESARATPEDFVKNVCLSGADGTFAVVIVKGEDRVDAGKVAALLGSAKLKSAKAEEVLEKTGYPVGGVPSFGYEARFVLDERIFQRPWVLTGGGSPRSLVRIEPDELHRANGGTVAVVRKTD